MISITSALSHTSNELQTLVKTEESVKITLTVDPAIINKVKQQLITILSNSELHHLHPVITNKH